MRTRLLLRLAVCLSFFSVAAHADSVSFVFNASLQTGPLAGTTFSGTGSYDSQGETGIGEEFLTLTSLDFALGGAAFTHADIDQGGQAILENGVLSYFTAAFFPPPPSNAPVNDIAFGFGGPGIIGYFSGADSGSGTYTNAVVPEAGVSKLCILGLILSAAVSPLSLRKKAIR